MRQRYTTTDGMNTSQYENSNRITLGTQQHDAALLLITFNAILNSNNQKIYSQE